MTQAFDIKAWEKGVVDHLSMTGWTFTGSSNNQCWDEDGITLRFTNVSQANTLTGFLFARADGKNLPSWLHVQIKGNENRKKYQEWLEKESQRIR